MKFSFDFVAHHRCVFGNDEIVEEKPIELFICHMITHYATTLTDISQSDEFVEDRDVESVILCAISIHVTI